METWDVSGMGSLLAIFGGARDWAQGLILDIQVLYDWLIHMGLEIHFFPCSPVSSL